MKTSNIKSAVPLFLVASMERSVRFYQNFLGFSIKGSWTPNGTIEWCWLERDGTALMLQEYREGNSDLTLTKGTGVSIWFQCRDALALYEEFSLKGITIDEPFVGNGMWDVRMKDPDTYIIHFESPTDVAEGTRYSDWVDRT